MNHFFSMQNDKNSYCLRAAFNNYCYKNLGNVTSVKLGDHSVVMKASNTHYIAQGGFLLL